MDEKELISQDDDTYNITKVLIYDNSTIKENVMFVCNMTIPGTEYSTAKYLEHSIGKGVLCYATQQTLFQCCIWLHDVLP